jgi:hypothetical protein
MMRRVASIRKSDGSAISFAELQELVAGDPELQLGPDATSNVEAINAVWSPFFDDPREPRVPFTLLAGVITVKNPPRGALRKMQQLAAKLSARVVDGEGNDITDREFPDLVTTDGCFRWATILVVLALAGLAWLVLR